ncbi:polyketide cyclase [Massilia horti]|uniref:Polyketide cyclase n=1 Tax=Massilia horti TaxID=2562153 RepID=A0A4Y9T815_9BURK|nr:polyketide cyclase [Massilia horti]TFW34936.1 polyketide cyclase [Massilia horti]
MFEARTISVSILHPWQALYEAIYQPEFFPRWASGLAQSTLEKEGEWWKASGPEGAVKIRFTPRNDFGVMDHYVDVGADQVVYMPMRVIPNADGAEVLLTLFRLPEMTDEKFEADAAWVEKDLKVLKSLFDG